MLYVYIHCALIVWYWSVKSICDGFMLTLIHSVYKKNLPLQVLK